ncbi:MAG: hypothetical protein WBI17_12525 [Clostridiaceae bacterium]
MKRIIDSIEFNTLNNDIRKIFGGFYGGNQHLSTKGLAMFGCGSVTLNNYVAYMDGKSYVKEELIKEQNDMFRKYLLGPTTALRFKLAAWWYYMKRGKQADVKIIHSFAGSMYGLKAMMLEIKRNIDKDIPVPLIVGLKLRKGYKDNLYSHWVTVTGYSNEFNILVSNNGYMETINLKELSNNRMFVATAAISLK